MVIDKETFTDLAIHLKMVSDAVLIVARHLAIISNRDDGECEENWQGALHALTAINNGVILMEKTLRAVLDANGQEPGPGLLVH